MRQLADDRDIDRALTWIVSVLRRHRVPFQIVGGLAAYAYGGRRPIVDLDFYAPLADADSFLAEIAEHTVWGPEDYQDDSWKLRFMKIDYGPVRIEIGDTSSEPELFDRIAHRWVRQHIDFTRSTSRTAFGMVLPVMPLEELLSYKAALSRPVDLLDIEELTAANPTQPTTA
ncbi:hypothetical protein [Micromonospora sp. URMC 103]|uniref:hypothetical protein n=1 Tax=Micromonospora sp. URMC 103 TaxID=3423406 RepID=UPI003F1B81FE